MEILDKYFDKSYCVNLKRRSDRWEKVSKEFKRVGFNNIERYDAIDGKDFDWTNISFNPSLLVGELGLLETHYMIIKEAIEKNYSSIIIFEDDVYFTDEIHLLNEYMEALPSDWDMIYLGGNHSYGPPPTKINDKIIKLKKTYTTHAIAIKNTLFETIIAMIEGRKKQIDVYYSDLQHGHNVYGFLPNIALQCEDFSDIQNRYVDYRNYFNNDLL